MPDSQLPATTTKTKQRKPKPDLSLIAVKLDDKARVRFLQTLADTGVVTRAAGAAGLTARACYAARERDADFAAAWDEAKSIFVDKLITEGVRRAHDGVEEPVFFRGEECGRVRKYSDTLLMFLLRGMDPNRFRDNASVEHSGPGGAPIQAQMGVFALPLSSIKKDAWEADALQQALGEEEKTELLLNGPTIVDTGDDDADSDD